MTFGALKTQKKAFCKLKLNKKEVEKMAENSWRKKSKCHLEMGRVSSKDRKIEGTETERNRE